MMNADQVVRDATNAASRHGTVISSEHQQELYYTGAADWASRMGSNLSLSTKNSLGRTFGRDTIVDLASGDPFNTRSISTNSNAHLGTIDSQLVPMHALFSRECLIISIPTTVIYQISLRPL
jgi:hypothetical protein